MKKNLALIEALLGGASPLGMNWGQSRIDEDGNYRSPGICYVVTPATAWGTQMTLLTGNTGGGLESLPQGNLVGAKEYAFVETVTLAAQVSGTVIGVARVPLGAVLLGILVCTDTSLGSTTIKFGNAASGNSAIYGAAATLTATDTPTLFTKTAVYGAAITSGYDCISGVATTFDKYSGSGGGYEDIIMTTGAATAPGSGTVRIVTKYAFM